MNTYSIAGSSRKLLNYFTVYLQSIDPCNEKRFHKSFGNRFFFLSLCCTTFVDQFHPWTNLNLWSFRSSSLAMVKIEQPPNAVEARTNNLRTPPYCELLELSLNSHFQRYVFLFQVSMKLTRKCRCNMWHYDLCIPTRGRNRGKFCNAYKP